MTIRLISTNSAATVVVDRAPKKQASNGDLYRIRSTLRNAVEQLGRPKGAVVGQGTVIFAIRSAARADMTVESRLPGGWLLGGGAVRLGPRQTFTVTSGSGRFANALGTGESTALSAGDDRRRLVYRLVLR